MKTPQEIVQSFEKKGVVLSVDASDTSKLSIEMSKDLAPSQYAELRECKLAIIEFLLSRTSASNDSDCVTPQQVLGVTNTSDLERQVVDFLKRYGDFGLKHIAKKLKRNEQEIRNIAQNSALVEYRKSNFDGVVHESLLLKEVNYPVRLVTFVELQRDLTIDDILKILEKCESFIKHHDKDHLDEWIEFCTRFVKFYRDGDNLIASLKTALIKIQLSDQL